MSSPVTYPNKNLSGQIVNDVQLAQWDLANGETGAALKTANYSDQNIHFHGDFSTGGAVELRGSNKELPDADTPEDWFIVRTAHDGSEITGVTTFYGAVILESVMWISPRCTAGDGSTSIKCSLKSNKRK